MPNNFRLLSPGARDITLQVTNRPSWPFGAEFRLLLFPFLAAVEEIVVFGQRPGVLMTGKRALPLEEAGATMVEYALLLVLLSGICLTVLTFLSQNMAARLTEVGQVIGGN